MVASTASRSAVSATRPSTSGSATLGSVWVLLDELAFEVGNQFAFTNVDGRPYQEALAGAIAEAVDDQG